ncbi:MAG: TolC family protein [Bryobacteraceae bacterium]|jgi:outer membrane protein TolC
MNRSILILLALASGGLAQDAASLKLTLRDAVNLALKQSPQVILANLEVARGEQARLMARSGLLPQAGADVSEIVHRLNVQAMLGLSFPGLPQHVGPYETFQAGVSVDAPIFDLTLWERYRSSRLGVEADRAQETGAREESVLLVVSQYLGGQRAAADVSAAQSRVDLAQALYNQAADLQKNGVGTGIDTLRSNVELQNEKQRLIVARTGLDTALFGLARLLNIDPLRRIELADQVSFFETPPTAVNETLERAYATRPELRQIATRQQQAELALRTAGDERLPRVSFSGFWMQLGLAPASVIPTYQYQFSLDVPIFTGGRIEAQRADAGLALQQLKQQEQDIRGRIALEVKTAIARLDAARGEVDVANQGVELARQEVEQARDRFQAGVTNNIEVISAQDALARANDNQIAALYRYNQSRADLAHSAGQMEALYAR